MMLMTTFIFILLTIILVFIKISIFTTNENFDNNNKYVCMYAYYEKNDSYKNNLKYFIKNGILDNVDYYIIINGECSVNIPPKKNIFVIKRQNIGYDFGGWSHCIENYLKNIHYDYYIFINSSVIGPHEDSKNDWLDKFLELFNNEDTKLVGVSINIAESLKQYYDFPGPYSHVQSFFFIINNEGFNYLLNNNFFNEDDINSLNFQDLIFKKEVMLSQLMLQNKWNINCILSEYKDYDYRLIKKNFNFSNEDPFYKKSYFGKTITEKEAIFYKNNR